MLVKNSTVRLEIEDLNNLGFGVAHADGQTVFVSGAVDGDLVDARVIRTEKTYAAARTERLVTASAYRRPSPCAAAGCGGCAYLSVSGAHEGDLKVARVRAAFRKCGLPDVSVLPLSGTGERYHYRNKAQYPVSSDGRGGLCIGFYAPKSHRVVEAADCPLQAPVFAPILRTVRRLLETHAVPAYREEDRTGLVRHIYLRTNRAQDDVSLVFVLNGRALPREADIVRELCACHPELGGILVNVNTDDTNVVLGKEYRLLFGKPYIEDMLCGVPLRIASAAFYQVNHDAAEALYARAADLAGLHGTETVLDLYCGVGSIGLSMAHRAREVVGVEIVPEAVRCARENAARAGIGNARFYCGDAGDAEALFRRAEEERGAPLRPDVVILDPPRKGCDERLLASLARRGVPRIVYISCHPETLARDAARLLPLGYTLGPVAPFDLFPCTGHVECVTAFTRPPEC